MLALLHAATWSAEAVGECVDVVVGCMLGLLGSVSVSRSSVMATQDVSVHLYCP